MAIIIIRTLIVFTAVITAMRIMGKRQLGELELSELIIALLISDLAAHPLQDVGIPLMNGLLPVLTLLSLELLLSGLIMRSAPARLIICGKPSFLVIDGVIQQKEMRKNRFTLDELTEELRGQKITDISKIKYAILETDGNLNAILYPGENTPTLKDLGINAPDTGYPMILINDGKVMDENLKISGRNIKWLEKEVKIQKAQGIKDVYLFTVNDAGQTYVTLKEKKNG